MVKDRQCSVYYYLKLLAFDASIMELRTIKLTERFCLNSQSLTESHLELTRTRLSAASKNTNLVSVEGLVFTEMNTQTESISEMVPKFWILQEH